MTTCRLSSDYLQTMFRIPADYRQIFWRLPESYLQATLIGPWHPVCLGTSVDWLDTRRETLRLKSAWSYIKKFKKLANSFWKIQALSLQNDSRRIFRMYTQGLGDSERLHYHTSVRCESLHFQLMGLVTWPNCWKLGNPTWKKHPNEDASCGC